MVIPIFEMLWVFGLTLIYSEFGERVTNEFNEVDNMFCHLNWYSLPKDIQRMLTTVIISTQEPIVLRGFGNYSCTRGSFQNVCFFIIITQTNHKYEI